MASMPTRIDGDLFEAAKAAGRLHSRSAAQQLAHWARIGRQFEASPNVTHDAINRVLSGQLAYDDIDEDAQAAVRATWDEGIAARIAGLDFTKRLEASGLPWAEADPDGTLVTHGPGSASA